MHCSGDKRKTTYFGSATDKFLGPYCQDKHLISCWNVSAEPGREPHSAPALADPAASPYLGSFSSAEKQPFELQCHKWKSHWRKEVLKTNPPAIFILWSLAAAASCPGRPRVPLVTGGTGREQPGKHTRHAQPGHHFQSARQRWSGPKGRGWLWRCPEGEQLKRTRKWDHRIAN